MEINNLTKEMGIHLCNGRCLGLAKVLPTKPPHAKVFLSQERMSRYFVNWTPFYWSFVLGPQCWEKGGTSFSSMALLLPFPGQAKYVEFPEHSRPLPLAWAYCRWNIEALCCRTFANGPNFRICGRERTSEGDYRMKTN